jgi:hypothetical protein
MFGVDKSNAISEQSTKRSKRVVLFCWRLVRLVGHDTRGTLCRSAPSAEN